MSLYSNFKHFPKSIGEIPTSYRDSISYEEQILWLCNFLEKEVLPQLEISQSIVDEIETAFDNLKKEDIYSGARVGALTAYEYDTLELTATEYDSKELTATEYDMNGKEELAS